MSFSGGGKGNSSTSTNQTAENFQTANSGAGTAVGGSGNKVFIQSTDVEALKASLKTAGDVSMAALASNLSVSHDALASNTNVADNAINLAGNVTSLNSALAGKFADDITKVQAGNISLLQSVGDNLVQNELGNKQIENAALQAAFSVAQGASPQTSAYANEQISGQISQTIKVVAIAGAVLIGAAILFKSLK